MAKEERTGQKRKSSYERYLEGSGIRVAPLVWFSIAIAVALAVALLMFFALPKSPTVLLMSVVVVPLLIVGFPILAKERRDSKIEAAVSDVFEELATSLRAGATVEQALLDLTKIQKGPLIEELQVALNDIEGGYSFEEALENIIDRLDVLLLKRILKIVIHGKKAGGELADILDSVSSDAREMARLQRERSSKTLMYVMFLFAAGAVVAPLIFGFVSQISVTVININNTTGVEALSPLDFIIFGAPISILWLYLMIECTISGIMISFVRGAKVWRGLLFYSLSMMLVSTIVFEVSRIIAAGMLATSSSGAAFA